MQPFLNGSIDYITRCCGLFGLDLFYFLYPCVFLVAWVFFVFLFSMRHGMSWTYFVLCSVKTSKAQNYGWLFTSSIEQWISTYTGSIWMLFFPFLQLNRNVTGPRHPGVIGDRGSGSFSRESKCTYWFIVNPSLMLVSEYSINLLDYFLYCLKHTFTC